MERYRAALVGCSRMGAFIDNEVPPSRRPYSHAAGYEACERTEMVACSDLRPEVMEQVGRRYGVPAEHQYTDYRQMIEAVKPEILSVATQPEQRCEIVLFAAAHGVRAIYAEKAFAPSLAEADAMVDACEAHGVILNMGTNRRWDPGYDRMKEVVESGRLGPLRSLVLHQTGTLFNSASHGFDLLLRLNSDQPVSWVQAHLPGAENAFDGDRLREDPVGHGLLRFEDGVTGYALNSGRGPEIEAVCSTGTAAALQNGEQWEIREPQGQDHRGRPRLRRGAFPDFRRRSSTVCLIEDLVHGLDTGEPPRGGARMARANTELIFAFIESHRRGGARVELPLQESPYRLRRDRAPRQPKYEADD